ncbi:MULTISPECIES: protein-L-isoaspartate O-methyltransferase family protein [unclassified Aureimonas]|uniref:protein-L-isoaspartate O-methyltransferase family protein n=1 Tax=unclassified Aureimonas TaxID=2615206 RepID=UPI0006FA56BE|nr:MULTISPECIES: protein-L-isoaspartate O-methyltransferase [unclassified Aureimonas]KQT60539.1 protein-L-isoaspartate O-methyltransferase [Aureimonas sp. Leaf427]KQT79416.1 protein-L-isoaspartate O-methyltransferase [Aureimonas sp. Leaf460]
MDFDAARIKMVDNQIRTTDVTDWAILKAFLEVPRELFVPEERRPLAYIDGDVPLGGGRFLMEASPFAKLLQLASIRPTDRVLDVGSASGYSAAILSKLAASVVALESSADLVAQARAVLPRINCGTVDLVEGALASGHAAGAPYDVILIEGSVETVPPVLFEQLAENGRLIAVEGRGNAASARLHIKEKAVVSQRFGFNCSIQPLQEFRKSAEFVF